MKNKNNICWEFLTSHIIFLRQKDKKMKRKTIRQEGGSTPLKRCDCYRKS